MPVVENVTAFYHAVAERTAEIMQTADTLTGNIFNMNVDCEGDVNIRNVHVQASNSGSVTNHQTEEAIDINDDDAVTQLTDALSATNDINRQLDIIGLSADVKQEIMLAVATKIKQSCWADAGNVFTVDQQSSGSCTTENLQVKQQATASIERCLQMAAVTLSDRQCPVNTCSGGSRGACRHETTRVCRDGSEGTSCPAEHVDCRLQALDALLTSQAERLAPEEEPDAEEATCKFTYAVSVMVVITVILAICLLFASSGSDESLSSPPQIVVVTK
jgi:hypothetical protein